MSQCESCGSVLDRNGGCQVCLLQLGISQYGASEEAVSDSSLPTIEELNDQFPQLEITGLIGRGGMGAIYHARQTNLERDVALKIIAKEVGGDPSFVERFEREAKTLARLSHPNIVTVFDTGRTQSGLIFLVMEYVDGINLREAINSQSVAAEDALQIVSTICSALQYAHGRGVVHRDIKPENILLGEDGVLKVADFGIAKIVDDSVRTPTLTATKQVLGSLHYLAPEHLESPSDVDHRVDLYALGVVFYEILTGQLPLGRYEAPSAIYRGVDSNMDDVVLKSLNRKPQQRYQSAAEMKAALQNLNPTMVAEVIDEASDEVPLSAGSNARRERRPIAFPFTCEAVSGFAEATGMVHYRDETVKFEFRIRDSIFGSLKSKTTVVELPLENIMQVVFTPGIFGNSMKITADSISALGEMPNAETGNVTLNVAKTDVTQAQNFADAINRVIAPEAVSQAPVANPLSGLARATHEDPNGNWVVFSILFLLLGIANGGALAGLQVMFADWRADDLETIISAVAAAVLIGPVSLLQIIAGLTSFVFRSRGLAWATAVVSLIPVSPVFILSVPVGIWAMLWLRREARKEAQVDPTPDRQSWGATTMAFVRETRWGKTVALANVLGVVAVVGGLAAYRFGLFATSMEYRVVDRGVDAQEVVDMMSERLPDNAVLRPKGDRIFIKVFASQMGVVREALEVERQPELIWIGNKLDDGPTGRTVDVVADLPIAESIVRTGELGNAVQVLGKGVRLETSYYSKLRLDQLGYAPILTLGLTESGKEALLAEAATESIAGLGLVIDGILVGFVESKTISSREIDFDLALRSEVSPAAIMAAIRGPEIPAELELIE